MSTQYSKTYIQNPAGEAALTKWQKNSPASAGRKSQSPRTTVSPNQHTGAAKAKKTVWSILTAPLKCCCDVMEIVETIDTQNLREMEVNASYWRD